MERIDRLPLIEHEQDRYLKNILLPQVGLAGQEKLKASSVLIIGLGGLGSAVGFYLAAAGIGHVGLMDHDLVADSNLQRQILHTTSRIGETKSQSAWQQLSDLNPYVQFDVYQESLTEKLAERIFPDYDVIVGCTDNFFSYYLINEICMKTGKPYVFGAACRFEGQVSVFLPGQTPCYECVFPKPAGIKAAQDPSQGVFSPVPGTIGTIQANECLKLLLGIGDLLTSKLLIYDALSMNFDKIIIHQDPDCKACAKRTGLS